MSRTAWLYIGAVLASAATVSIFALTALPYGSNDWLPFVVLLPLAIFAQLYRAQGPNHSAFFATPLFFMAGNFLLSPGLFVLLVIVTYVVEWLKVRLWGGPKGHLAAWYIQPFNISMHVLAGSVTMVTHITLDQQFSGTLLVSTVFTHTLTAALYTLVGQILLGQAFVLARGLSWKDSGILTTENLLPEFMLACIGVVIAALWQVDHWLLLPGLAPLVLLYRALMVPKLKEDAQIDGKTNLYNARHFKELFTKELERARRLERPLAFIMADLDLLRAINNTFGHLAGDTVLEGVGKIIRKTVREYDIAGRFGGEEFAIVVPEADREQALLLAERIRRAVEEASYQISSSAEPICATMSLGVACFPDDAQSLTDLIHEADVAVYQAKFQGRNRVVCATDVPHSVKLDRTADPAAAQYAAAFTRKSSGEKPAAAEPTSAAPAPAAPSVAAATAPGAATQRARQGEPARPAPRDRLRDVKICVLVGSVVAAGIAISIQAASSVSTVSPFVLVMLCLIAVAAELLQINVFDENSMSVSLAAIAAAGLIYGLPGVVILSATIALADQLHRRRPVRELYKVAFNWGTHAIGGAAFALGPAILGVPLQVDFFAPLLMLALVAATIYYISDSVLISAAIAITKGTRLYETWHAQFRWLAGYYLVLGVNGLFLALAYEGLGVLGLLVFIVPAFMLRYAQQQYVVRTQDSMRELRRLNTELRSANHEIAAASEAIQELNGELLEMVARVFDARDPYSGGHAAKVAEYACAIATEIGLSPERVKIVRQAALLHDIGKIAISEQVLSKPTQLTSEEYQYVKSHTTIGAELLEASRGLRHLAPFVRHHHERWDGSGYPNGLRGEAIPLESRILSICDAAEAMLSDRPYHRGMELPMVLAEVRRCAGTQFDPTIAEVFVKIAQHDQLNLVVNSAHAISMRLDTPHSVS